MISKLSRPSSSSARNDDSCLTPVKSNWPSNRSPCRSVDDDPSRFMNWTMSARCITMVILAGKYLDYTILHLKNICQDEMLFITLSGIMCRSGINVSNLDQTIVITTKFKVGVDTYFFHINTFCMFFLL